MTSALSSAQLQERIEIGEHGGTPPIILIGAQGDGYTDNELGVTDRLIEPLPLTTPGHVSGLIDEASLSVDASS